MADFALDSGMAALSFARKTTLRLLEDIPADRLTHRPCAGGNHALWVLGHIAWTDDYFLQSVARQATCLPVTWGAQFGMGSTPADDAAAYPVFDEVGRRAGAAREALLGWFRSLSPQQLASATPENLRNFAPTFGALMGAIACHECLHAGQITVVRRSLGLGPLSG